ncbi:hypothetical protein [Solimonas flava]|uniref:hypothetical protein n=1 Tax=Solimonas flava TaxID=415849 RepID=UPI00048A3636|nr:hypothetical protein [Solimonas flava]
MNKSSHKPAAASRVETADLFTGIQGDFFQRLEDEPQLPADLDIHYELLAALTAALKLARERGMTRSRVVDEMNRLMPELRKKITYRQLDAWTAASQEYKEFPARFIPAFCAATRCDLPLRVMAQPLGRVLMDAHEAAAKRIGELRIAGAAIKREERALTRQHT